jgi:PAS domain S-box-containing protein
MPKGLTRGRILIVEDEGIVATDMGRCLEDAGFSVSAIATSLEDALTEVSKSRPDLILMDIRIQGSADGIEAADELHQRFGLPVVFLTAHDDRDTLDRAKRAEPMAFLLKPFKPAELTSTVEIALDRNWAEEKVRERERAFLSAMDSIGDAVLTTDTRGSVRFMNRAAEQLFGWTQSEAIGTNAAGVINAVGSDGRSDNEFGALLAGNSLRGSDAGIEHAIVTKHGDSRWITIKTTTIDGVEGAPVRVIVMQDITRRKQSQEALKRQADLLDQAQEPIFTWDLDGTVTYWNRAAAALYGYSAHEARGTRISQLLKTSVLSGDESIQAALERDRRWAGELTRTTRNGDEIVIECLLAVVQDAGGRATVLETDRDVTTRKRTETEIRRLNQDLNARVAELTALNEELDSFNYSVSHDLRAPLRHIDGYSKVLLKQCGAYVAEDDRRCMERIRDGARKAGRMVDELLDLSRTSRRELSRQWTDLNSLVTDVIEELKTDAQDEDIDWRIAQLPRVYCDVTLMRQVFANLISNAVKFSRGRKPPSIEVAQTSGEGSPVLFVRDNGVGFNMKYADKLFGVFQRLHRSEDFEGTGVGLVTAQRIVHKHGGRIWAEAELEKGATFYFTIGAPGGPQHPTDGPTVF